MRSERLVTPTNSNIFLDLIIGTNNKETFQTYLRISRVISLNKSTFLIIFLNPMPNNEQRKFEKHTLCHLQYKTIMMEVNAYQQTHLQILYMS